MIVATFEESGPWPPGLKRELPKAQKKGFKLSGNKWHRAYSRGHFKMSAISKYKYRKRTKKYLKEKQRTKHHQLPLVWSGTTRNRALRRDVKSTSKKGTVTLHVQALNFGRYFPELTAIIESEILTLEKVFARSIENSFNRVSSGKKIIMR